MNRELTAREKVLLLVLSVLLIAVGYFKYVYEPVQSQIADAQSIMAQEQTELMAMQAQLAKMREMQEIVAEAKAAGEVGMPVSSESNGAILLELHRILENAAEYTIDFSSQTQEKDYLVLRPVLLTFQTADYAKAREIIDSLSRGDFVNRISELNISTGRGTQKNMVQTALTVTYFEISQ